jgi:selenocysteine lyase/cysteine desulfurase
MQHVRLFALSHITARPSVLLPVKEIVQKVKRVCPDALVLVDGAQALGQLARLGIQDIGADFYVASLAKWFCAPPGVGMLWVHPEHQENVFPVCTRFVGTFQHRFIYNGLRDQTQMSVVKDLVRIRQDMLGEIGQEGLVRHCQELVQEGAQLVAQALGTEVFPLPGSGLETSTCCVRLPIEDLTLVYQVMAHVAEIENVHFTVINIGGVWWVRLAACLLLEYLISKTWLRNSRLLFLSLKSSQAERQLSRKW